MSTRNLIDAIASGSALDIESAFEDTMAEKVSVQIEAKRLQIAQTMFTTEEVDLDALTEEELAEWSELLEGNTSVRHLYNKYADRYVGGDGSLGSHKPIQATIEKIHGKKVMSHMKKAAKANARGDMEGEGRHFRDAEEHAANVGRANALKSRMSRNEEVDLDEAATGYDSSSAAHKRVKDMTSKYNKDHKTPEYHPDGTASIHYRSTSGHPDSPVRISSTTYVDHDLGHAGGLHNHSEKDLANHKQTIKGLKWHVKKTTAGHTVHIKEEVDLDEEQLDELSKKTLGSYVKKATSHGQGSADGSIHNLATQAADDYHSGIEGGPEDKKSYKRSKGIARAVNKLTKEELDLDEEQSEQE